MDELHRMASLGRHFGLNPSVVDGSQVAVPGINASGIVGALRVEEDATVNPVDLCMAYARGARMRGATIREGQRVSRLLVESGRIKGVCMADGSEVAADRVALCAGAWSKKLADDAGVSLPLQAVEHMYVVTEPMDGLPNPYPVLRDLDRNIYVKGDVGKLVIGAFEPDAKTWNPDGPGGGEPFLEFPEDWDHIQPFMEVALDLLPVLEKRESNDS